MVDLLRAMPRREVLTANTGSTVAEAVQLMKERGVSQLPVVDSGRLSGIVTESDLLGKLVEGRAAPDSKVAEVMFRNVRTVHVADDAGVLTDLFAEGLVGLAIDDRHELHGIITKMDLVDYLTRPLEAAN